MERNLFKSLLTGFEKEEVMDKKVDFLLTFDLKTLTNPQLQKILDTLNDEDVKKLNVALSKKTGE